MRSAEIGKTNFSNIPGAFSLGIPKDTLSPQDKTVSDR
jgi:hypothetical protein